MTIEKDRTNEYPAEQDRKSMEVLGNWLKEKRQAEEGKRGRVTTNRDELARRNNQKERVVTIRAAKCKPGLGFTALGPWAF